MPKLFAIFIPIGTILITTVIVTLLNKKKENEEEKTNYFLLLMLGIGLISGFILFLIYKY